MTTEPQAKSGVDTILHPGKVVDGKYRIDRLVGRGGMAAVWAGTNERTGKSVALKVILKSFAATPEAEQLFRREALAASKVNHPNVVTVFDVIDHEGMTCIVMELLDGEPLSNYLARKGFLSAEETIALLLPAMRGVAAANAQGVVHRDLKPQNIFICIGPDGRHVTTKVLDFGISVMVERALDASSHTVPGLTMGTPAYMSPEHISGARTIDERADVYGFGVLLYEMLTGQLPFMGEPGPALLLRILNEAPPPVTLFRPDLPPALVRIVEAAMAKKPDHRYSDVNSLVRALEEEFMLPTPMPRSLTPFAGVPVFPMRDGPSARIDGAVLSPHRKDASAPHSISETQMLFALSPDAASVGPNVPATQLVVASGRTTALVSRTPGWMQPVVKVLGIKGAIALGGGLLCLLIVFFAFPFITKSEPASTAKVVPAVPQPPVPAVPTVKPAEVVVSPIAQPTEPTAEKEAEPVVEDSEPTSGEVEKSAGKQVRSRKIASAHQGGKVSKSVDGVPPSTKPSANTRGVGGKLNAPRAGNLSPDDF